MADIGRAAELLTRQTMFGGLKNLAGLASMMSQAGGLQEKVAQAKERISRMTVEGVAGGDLVRIVLACDLQVHSISIQQGVVESRDRERIENLTRVAMEDAIRKAKETAAREMAVIAEGMNIPGLQDAMAKMGLG
jgi:nucleoid-associated protein EbfC